MNLESIVHLGFYGSPYFGSASVLLVSREWSPREWRAQKGFYDPSSRPKVQKTSNLVKVEAEPGPPTVSHRPVPDPPNEQKRDPIHLNTRPS